MLASLVFWSTIVATTAAPILALTCSSSSWTFSCHLNDFAHLLTEVPETLNFRDTLSKLLVAPS